MLKINQLSKSFPGLYQPILNQLSLQIKPGEFCVLIGSNGSGKSTLLKILSGEYTADQGEIYLDDVLLTLCSVAKRSKYLSRVDQDVQKGTVGELTVLENLILSHLRGHKAKLLSYRQRRAQFSQLLADLPLPMAVDLDQPMATLSGGQRQMVATLMAMQNPPALLLLDEHTSALDPRSSKSLMSYTAEQIQRHRITTLMVTHHLNDAIRYGDRLIMLHAGSIALDVSGEEKKQLTIQQLLQLFHQLEDKNILDETGDFPSA